MVNPFQSAFEAVKKELNGAKDSLENSRIKMESAGKSVEHLSSSGQKISATIGTITTRLSASSSIATQAVGLQQQIEQKIEGAEATVQECHHQVKKAEEALEKITSQLLNFPLTAYSYSIPFVMTFNAVQCGVFAQADVGFGVRLGATELEAILKGTFKLPRVNLFESVTYALGAVPKLTSDYEGERKKVENQLGEQNVYVASQRFVDWASPERIIEAGIQAILFGGAGAKDAALDALYQLELEFDDLLTWLRNRSVHHPVRSAISILESLVTGDSSSINFATFRAVKIPYRHEVVIRGISEIPGFILEKLGVPRSGIDSDSVDHLSFQVEFSNTPVPVNSLRDAALLLTTSAMPSKNHSFWDAVKLYGGGGLKNIVQLASSGQQVTEDIGGGIMRTLKAEFAISGSLKSKLRKSNASVVDLSDSDIASRLDVYLDRLAFGNEGAARILSMKIDLLRGLFLVEGVIQNRHSWGTVHEAMKAIGAKLGLTFNEVDLLAETQNLQFRSAEKASEAARATLQVAESLLASLTSQLKKAAESTAESALKVRNWTGKLGQANGELKKLTQKLKVAEAAHYEAAKAWRGAKRELNGVEAKYNSIKQKFERWTAPLSIPKISISMPRIRRPRW